MAPTSTKVEITHPDRVLFPEDGVTIGDLFRYYDAVAPVLVPHLHDRPFTMKRWREGLPPRWPGYPEAWASLCQK